MPDNLFGRRRQDKKDVAAMIAVLQENHAALNRIAKTSHMSFQRIISLAVQHFGSLSFEEQLRLAEEYLG